MVPLEYDLSAESIYGLDKALRGLVQVPTMLVPADSQPYYDDHQNKCFRPLMQPLCVHFVALSSSSSPVFVAAKIQVIVF